MRKKLTEIAVQKLTPKPGQRLEVYDAITPGLMLRITERGKKSWSIVYRVAGAGVDGKRGPLRRMTLGQHPLIELKEARKRAREAIDAADRGIDFAVQRQEQARERHLNNFETICTRFIELHIKAHTKKWRDTERLLNKYVVPAWRGLSIEDIDRAAAHKLLDELLTKHGTSIAREVRKHMTKLFNWAVDRGALAVNPVAGMRRPELRYIPRERVLSMDELRAIWAGAGRMGYPFGSMIQMLILTAQRRAEIAKMRRDWILDDIQAFEVPASMYKTDRPQVVPLSGPARTLLDDLPRWNAGQCLFSTTAGQKPVSGFSKAKARAIRESGIDDWTLHDIRRSVATHMARLGVAQEHIERVLGHVIEGVAGTYNRYSYLDEKRAALERWGREWN